jgi:hypothetical protein
VEVPRVFARYVPSPDGLLSPWRWDVGEHVRELLDGGVGDLRVTRCSFVFRYRSFRHYLEILKTHLGPTRRAFESLDAAERESLEGDLADLVRRMDRSGDGTMVVPSDYLEVAAVRT